MSNNTKKIILQHTQPHITYLKTIFFLNIFTYLSFVSQFTVCAVCVRTLGIPARNHSTEYYQAQVQEEIYGGFVKQSRHN